MRPAVFPKEYSLTSQIVTRGKSLSKDTSKQLHTTLTSQGISDATSDNSSPETVDTATVSTPPEMTPTITDNVQLIPPSTPPRQSFDEDNTNSPKGLQFFRTKKTLVPAFNVEDNAIWREGFFGSRTLSWNDTKSRRDAVNLYVIGRSSNAYLINADSIYGSNYRLQLILDERSTAGLQMIMDNGPWEGIDEVKYPIVGRTISLKAKLGNLQKEVENLKIDDQFPFFWDGREMGEGQVLNNYPAEQLRDGNLLAVQFNVSAYDIKAKFGSPAQKGYSLAMRVVYFLGEDVDSSNESSLKRPGDSLVSPRKNKRAGDVAVFSDEE